MTRSDFVSGTIVTYNSGRFIKRCLESVLDQNYPLKEIIVIDNNSADGTIDILEPFEDRCRIIYNEENIGFAAAQNQAIAASSAEWVLTLNPDVLLLQGFIEALVTAGNLDPRAGTVCGKLLTMSSTFDFPEEPLIDSTGIYFTPNLRHLDRGSLEVDNGHFRNYEYVFGATAAAALYRREMINDIEVNGEFFDADFFVYREDADVAWRAQLMGWKCLYAPYAKGYHVRNALPGNRRALPDEIQHALGEEPLPAAHEKHQWRSLSAQFLLDNRPRYCGRGLLPALGTQFPQSVSIPVPQLEKRHGQTPRNYAPPAR